MRTPTTTASRMAPAGETEPGRHRHRATDLHHPHPHIMEATTDTTAIRTEFTDTRTDITRRHLVLDFTEATDVAGSADIAAASEGKERSFQPCGLFVEYRTG